MSLSGFPKHLHESLPQLHGAGVLVALSGGSDSVALLHLLAEADVCARIEAAHVHHGARGLEADRDVDFVRELCRQLGIECHVRRLAPSNRHAEGLEAGWRRLRYQALLEVRDMRRLDLVATGHQRDDVAEGVLMQLLRGAGPRAMSGIRALTPEGVVRPLLPWPRHELRRWLQDRGLRWREDASNADTTRLRARVRQELLPLLETASRGLREHLCHLAEALARDEAAANRRLADLDLWIDPWHPDGGVEIAAIRDLDAAQQVRWLHAQASRIGLDRISHAQLAGFLQLLADGSPRSISLSGRWSLRQCGGRLWLEPPSRPGSYEISLHPQEIPTGEELPIPGWRLVLRPGPQPSASARWWRPLAVVAAGPVVRSPRPGDRVGGGHRVSDLLRLRIPRHLRGSWPLCCEGDRITWIPGVWQDGAPGKAPTHVLEVMRT